MLYIKFDIQDNSKYHDFLNLYEHMVNIRKPGFEFEDGGPEIDWDSLKTQKEVDAAVKELGDFLDLQPEVHRYNVLIPSYVKELLQEYLEYDNDKLQALGVQDVLSLFNYLEYGFEVEMDSCKQIDQGSAIVEFSTGNYPFGGIDRFFATLIAYGLNPTECFDGFNVCKIEWTSIFEYNSFPLDEKTKEHVDKYKN